MATSTAVPAVRRTHRTFVRVLLLLIAVIVLAFAGVGTWIYASARAALPKTDGRLPLPGLIAPVTVTRDPQGVPHIRAANLQDLFFAQGYVTAQDRLWQMDMTRRFAAGELSEILGPDYLEHDRMQRILLIRATAERHAAELPPDRRAQVEAYARGVNAYIAQQRALPLEFRLLRYTPRPWTPVDTVLVTASMVQMLNLDMIAHELSRERITARVGPELAADLYPNSSWRDHPPVSAPGEDEFTPPDEEENGEEQPPAPPAHRARPPRRRARVKRAAFDNRRIENQREQRVEITRSPDYPIRRSPDDPMPGSNNWVISGAHSVSGKPLLANDMHLPHQIPNIWYEAHLTAGNFDVAGVTLPGFPYIIVGHNQRIAWGFTNIGPAVTDLFIENFNERGEYQTPQGWQQPEHRRDVIRVRDGKLSTATHEVPVDITITRHGPIVSSVKLRNAYVGSAGEPLDRTRQLALKWTFYEAGSMQNPFFDMDSAQNWDEFRRALRQFASPAQNVVYADVDGHIGSSATGMIPIRACGTAPGCGTAPASGTDDTHEWTGYIPFEQLPSGFDPPSGIIATANGRITPEGYPNLISGEWGSPYRTERIYKVLGANKRFTAADMLMLQTDVYSDFDRFCAQRFVYAVDHAAKPSAKVREAAELMRSWDGGMTTDSPAATLAVRARLQLTRLLLQPKLGEDYLDYRWFMQPVWLENVLLHQPARWLPADYTSWDDLLAAAVDAAVTQPSEPGNVADWKWGKQEPVSLEHPLFGRIPVLRRWAGTGTHEQSGGRETVKQVGRRFGPSERMTVDFADLDASTLNVVSGQSGQIFSPHFLDQWSAWYDGRTFTLPYSAAAVEKSKAHQLTLEPGK